MPQPIPQPIDQLQVTHNGVTITFNQRHDHWEAKRGDRVLTDVKLSELKKKLDRVAKVKAERLTVLHATTGMSGQITSYAGYQPRVLWDNGTRDTVFTTSLVDASDDNRAIFEQLKSLRLQHKELNNAIYTLESKLTRTTIRAHFQRQRALAAGEIEQ